MATATVTVSLNTFFQPAEGEVLSFLRASTGLQILSVDRAFMSGRFVVSFDNSSGLSDAQIAALFLSAMSAAGYQGEVISVEAGSVSSVPGGFPQVVTGAAATANSVLGPVLIPAAIIAVAVLVIIYFPRKG